MIPQLQTSTEVPSYFLSPTISGAAQLGLPQAVFKSFPSFMRLLSPKSTILMILLAPMRIFSGLRSLWAMRLWCAQATPLMICLKKNLASSQLIQLFWMQSQSYPPYASSIITKISLLVSNTQYSFMMLWWLMNFRIRIYLLTFIHSILPLRSYVCSSFCVCLLSLRPP